MVELAGPGVEITDRELAQATRNRGMPLEALRHDITPVGLHYLLIHFDIPALDPACRVQERSRGGFEFRAEPNDPTRLTNVGGPGSKGTEPDAAPGSGAMRTPEPAGALRSRDSARGSRAGAGPSEGTRCKRERPRSQHPDRSILSHCAGELPASIGNTDWGRSGHSVVRGPLPLERGPVSAIRGGRRRGLPLAVSVLLVGPRSAAGGRDGQGLGPQELRPRRSDPPRGRPQTSPAQQVRDRHGGDRDAELEELALDPEVAPPCVLPGHPKDQLPNLGIDGRASWPATVRPFPAQELPTPPVERVGNDREGRPPLPGEEPAGRDQ